MKTHMDRTELQRCRDAAEHGFAAHEKDGLVYFSIPKFDDTGRFRAIFTSRTGGVSPGEFSSLNLSRTRENSPSNKKENYIRAARAAGADPASLVLVNYEHGTGICLVTPENCGEGLSKPTTLPPCDAIVVSEPGVTALTLHADCVPVFLADPVLGIGAAAHAGWKGTAGRLPEKLVRKFVEEFGSRPENLLGAIGPHIRACCFEVGEEVASIFEEEFGSACVLRKDNEKPHVDLEAAILIQFAGAGLPARSVTLADRCTYCEEDLFYSHRRDRGKTGAMGSFIAVLPQ